MSSEVSIRAVGIGKRYRIGATQGIGRYRTLREDITGLAARTRDKAGGLGKEFWALKDVSFEIRGGETVGIIGRNGAGKSTVLKILSRITPPTLGRAEIVGRVGSLLEVGTGFHPELTGRENVMLSAAIMGMRRQEVLARFDAIVEFSGLAQFLDTPVKRYSSGMYMRLAFSVAAHLEPEILLVDEVLAVGDAAFQKKCLGRMEELSGTGRTVLFVSHSTSSVIRLCPRTLLLDSGGVVADGPSSQVVSAYLGADGGGTAERTWTERDGAPGDDVARLQSVRVIDEDGHAISSVSIQRPVGIQVEYIQLTNERNRRVDVFVDICNEAGIELFVTQDANNGQWREQERGPGVVRSTCWLPGNLLAEGTHAAHITLGSSNPHATHAHERDAVAFQVVDQTEGDGVRGDWPNEWPGVVRPMLDWTIETEPLRQLRES